MGKFLGILAAVLVVYFVITRPVAAANTAEDIGGALATAADSLVVFADALVGGTSDDPSGTVSSPESDTDAEADADTSDPADRPSVPTSVPAGTADE